MSIGRFFIVLGSLLSAIPTRLKTLGKAHSFSGLNTSAITGFCASGFNVKLTTSRLKQMIFNIV